MRKTRSDSKVRRNLSKRRYNEPACCTDVTHKQYPQYGGAGVTISESWNDKERFIEDAKKLPGYADDRLLNGDLHLDKDTLNPTNKVYSAATCAFVSIEDNNKVKPNQMPPFEAVSPNGEIINGLNQSEFAKEHGLTQSTISACLKGKIKRYQGWTFRLKE